MNTATYVDIEGPVRTWLRAAPITGVDARLFFALPERVAFPAAVMTLIDGGVSSSEAPVADARFSFSIWGGTQAEAAEAAWSLVSIIQSARSQALDETLVLLGAQVTLGPVFQPDPDGKARYIVDAALTVRTP